MLLAIGICLVGLGPDTLPGHRSSLEQAKNDASLIVTAEIEDVGGHSVFGLVATFQTIKLKAPTILKGKLEGGDLDRLHLMMEVMEEQEPRAGDKAIFFIKKSKSGSRIIKMLELTDENEEATKAPAKKSTASARSDLIARSATSIAAPTQPVRYGARRTCGQSIQPL